MKKLNFKSLLKGKNLKKACLIILGGGILCLSLILAANGYVVMSVKDRVLAPEKACHIEDVDCILVLGCAVRGDGSPSAMLYDRISAGVELYEWNASPKIIMSGDHGRVEYNEVGKMKEVAVSLGVPTEDIFMDHAGFSTYESIYRAKEIFGAKKIIIVSQEYHLYRALYLAQSLGIESYGVRADYRQYGGQLMRDIREVAARIKDIGYSIFKPEPTYLGEPVSLGDSGDVTNDKYYEEIIKKEASLPVGNLKRGW